MVYMVTRAILAVYHDLKLLFHCNVYIALRSSRREERRKKIS